MKHDDWLTLDFIDPPSLSAQNYIIVAWGGVAGCQIYYDTTAPTNGRSQSITYDGWPDPLNPTTGQYNASIYCTYTVGAEENFFGEINQILFEYSFPAHELTWSFNRYPSVTETTLIEHGKTWSFNVYQFAYPLFTIESNAEFISAVTHNFHGLINMLIEVTTTRTWSFTLNRFINPLFTIESTAEFISGVIHNFYGEIPMEIAILTSKTLSFVLNPSINPLFTIEGYFSIPNLVNLAGIIGLTFNILGYSPIVAPTTLNDVIAFASIAFIIAIVALAIALTRKD